MARQRSASSFSFLSCTQPDYDVLNETIRSYRVRLWGSETLPPAPPQLRVNDPAHQSSLPTQTCLVKQPVEATANKRAGIAEEAQRDRLTTGVQLGTQRQQRLFQRPHMVAPSERSAPYRLRDVASPDICLHNLDPNIYYCLNRMRWYTGLFQATALTNSSCIATVASLRASLCVLNCAFSRLVLQSTRMSAGAIRDLGIGGTEKGGCGWRSWEGVRSLLLR